MHIAKGGGGGGTGNRKEWSPVRHDLDVEHSLYGLGRKESENYMRGLSPTSRHPSVLLLSIQWSPVTQNIG